MLDLGICQTAVRLENFLEFDMFNLFDSPIEFRSYLEDVRAVADARAIASKKAWNDSRTLEEKFIDALNGCSVQYAVYDLLLKNGFDVSLPPADRKEYDLILRINSRELCIDVKGIFKKDSKYFGQTAWERKEVPKLGFPVYYFCFDCRDGKGEFRGWCDDRSFTPSKFNYGTYIDPKHLEKSLDRLFL